MFIPFNYMCFISAIIFGKYVILLFSSNSVNEILGLFISNLLGVILLKLYFSQMVLVLIFFLDDERYHSNVVKLVLNI